MKTMEKLRFRNKVGGNNNQQWILIWVYLKDDSEICFRRGKFSMEEVCMPEN